MRNFFRLDYLIIYIRIYIGEKLFVCDICGRRFVRFDERRRYMKIYLRE